MINTDMVIKPIIVLLSLTAVGAKIIDGDQPECNSCINGLCYATTIFSHPGVHKKIMTGIPDFDLTNNDLYYSSGEISYSMKIPKDIKSYPTSERVIGIPKYAIGFTVDQKTRDVYVWMQPNDEYVANPNAKNTSFSYNPIEQKMVKIKLIDEDIREMHFKNGLYFTLKHRNGLFDMINYPSPVPKFQNYNISQFVIDKLGDIYFTTDTGMYRLKKGSGHIALLTSKSYALSVNKDDNVYILDTEEKTVFKMDYDADEFVEAGAFSSEVDSRFIFDKYDNILYRVNSNDEAEANWVLLLPKGRCRIDVDQEGKRSFVRDSNKTLHQAYANAIP